MVYVGGFLCAGGGPKKQMQGREKVECQLCLAYGLCCPQKWMQGLNQTIYDNEMLLIPFGVHEFQMQFSLSEERNNITHCITNYYYL